MFRGWEKTTLTIDGISVVADAPLIVSASRATDIPSFYAEWFIRSLRRGYVKRINPFNRNASYISFKNLCAVVFWSKNPFPLIDKLSVLDNLNIGYYFQFTLNDYDAEGYEPNVPPLRERIALFKRLSEHIGKEKIIWRFDPILLTEAADAQLIISKFRRIIDELHSYTERCVFSFADINAYPKVQSSLNASRINAHEASESEMKEIAGAIGRLCRDYGIAAATCAEGINLDEFGIRHNKCIDDELLVKLFPNNKTLMNFLCPDDNAALFAAPSRGLKDKGQRKLCGCIVSKDIGQYATCPHMCAYCYANGGGREAYERWSRHNPDADIIAVD